VEPEPFSVPLTFTNVVELAPAEVALGLEELELEQAAARVVATRTGAAKRRVRAGRIMKGSLPSIARLTRRDPSWATATDSPGRGR